jgi:type II secretory pathway pseudopilin PulG
VVVLVLGLAITGVLASVTATVNDRNENRLLAVQVREAGLALGESIQNIETPLASATAIAGVNDGQTTSDFNQFMSSYVGKSGPFAYVALCGEKNGIPTLLDSLGTPGPTSEDGGSLPCSFLTKPPNSSALTLKGFVDNGNRLGYSYRSLSGTSPIGVYVETQLPPHRTTSIGRSSLFPNLDFAFYLGRSQQLGDLLETTTKLPITGRKAVAVIPIANIDFTLVGTPTQPLGGSLSRDLTFFVILFGILLTGGATVMTERLARRRRSAEGLAVEIRHLYAEQQTLAGVLQTALLPKLMPEIPGVEAANLYVAGLEVMDIGGDWFDLISCSDGGFIFVVGDVSGRGVEAAIVMASLHYAIRAYAAEGDQPGAILTKLGGLLDVGQDGHFATVLCGHVDSQRRTLSVASAGHFPPLVMNGRKADFVDMIIGPPIGAVKGPRYPVARFELPSDCTLVAFTDGLVERRGQLIDVGLAELEDVVSTSDRPLAQLLPDLVAKLTPQGSDDDIAILGLRWTS